MGAAGPEARGIFQGDIIIQSAIRQGFRDLRANPWLVDYMLASLPQDDLTAGEYGQKQVEELRRWVLKTEIPVFINARIDNEKLPAITINLVESAETDNQLGDLNYVTTEPVADEWPALTHPFSPLKWTPATGELVLPSTVTLDVYPGMNVVDRGGQIFQIQDVKDDGNNHVVLVMDENIIADFTGAVIKAGSPATVVHYESAFFRESYLIGAHVVGHPGQLIMLHTALVFILLRYRQSLLEARGLEISSFSSTDFSKTQVFDPEQVWSRYLSLTGKVRHVWPKEKVATVQGVKSVLVVEGGEHLPSEFDVNDSLFIGDEDEPG